MADRVTLKLELRDTLGKKVKRLRQEGIIPVHLYGPGISSRSLQCRDKELIRALTQAGRSTPVTVTVEGEGDEHLAFVREIQWDPIRGNLFHVDLLRAEATQRVSADVNLVLTGESPGAREAFGRVVQLLHSITVEALPLEMPQDVQVDLSTLTEPDGAIRSGDIPLPTGAVLVSDSSAMVARIEVARTAVDEEAPSAQPEGEEPA